jgi:WD40 repeat protein
MVSRSNGLVSARHARRCSSRLAAVRQIIGKLLHVRTRVDIVHGKVNARHLPLTMCDHRSFCTHRNRVTTSLPFSPSIQPSSRLFVVSHDGKFLFSGGHWDWSLQIVSLAKCKPIESCIAHTDVITCLALDSTGYVLVTGSRDTTCMIWLLSSIDAETTSILSAKCRLYGHVDAISCVCVSSHLDLVVSASLDGTCNMYTVDDGTYVRTLRPTASLNHPVVELKLSDQRHLLVQTEQDETHLLLYSINGNLIRTRKYAYRIDHILLNDHHVILAINHCPIFEEKNGFLIEERSTSRAARIIIKDLFE